MKCMNHELVTVIITTYKRSDMLETAIESVLNQTYQNLEIIVVDDNHPDSIYRKNTERKMKKYLDNNKVIYIKHSKNLNGASARNTGIKNSKGYYITYLDDDDTYRRKKIEKQVKYLKEHSEYDAVYCGWHKNNMDEIPTETGDLTFGVLSSYRNVITNTIMMKKEATLKIKGWDTSFSRNQEAAFLLRYFNMGYKIGVISEVLVDFDMSDRSNEADPKEAEKNMCYFLEHHESLIKKMSKTEQKIIYSRRFRDLFLNYIKNKEYGIAVKLYFKTSLKHPVEFNKELIDFTFNRIFKR